MQKKPSMAIRSVCESLLGFILTYYYVIHFPLPMIGKLFLVKPSVTTIRGSNNPAFGAERSKT